MNLWHFVVDAGLIGSEAGGWPHRDAIPVLPVLDQAGAILWVDINLVESQHRVVESSRRVQHRTTGLLDAGYWCIEQWGSPYYALDRCQRCGLGVVISEMRFPYGDRELKANCQNCGVLAASARPE